MKVLGFRVAYTKTATAWRTLNVTSDREGVTKFGGQEEDKAKIDVDLKIVSSGSCGATPRLLRRDSTQYKPPTAAERLRIRR